MGAIEPGKYASTTQCADSLLERVGVKRQKRTTPGPSRLPLESEARREEAEGRATAALRRAYGLVYAPQDRLAEALVARRPALTSPVAVSLLANLGMSTQLAAFGLLIALGHPIAFAWVALAEVAVIALALLPRRAPSRQEEIA